MADTALTLITDALLDLGVLADEDTPSASQSQGGLRKLNNLLDSWSIERLLVYGASFHLLPLVAGKSSYTIGTGGDLNITRPSSVMSVFARDVSLPVASQVDLPLDIYTDQEWQNIAFKNQQATYPFNGVWIDYGYPLITLRPNPIASTSQYSLVVWTSGLIGSLAIDQVIALPPGYKRAITSNLALEMGPSYGVEPSNSLVAIARDSKAKLQINNLQMDEMELPFVLGGYDITTNRYL